MVFDRLRDRPEVRAAGVRVPETTALKQFIASGVALGNPGLEQVVQESGNPDLAAILRWSKDVNALIERTVKNVPPFRWVRESLEKIRRHADAICVSQTPTEALVREWEEHALTGFVSVIAGQELGTKAEHLAMATANRYPPERILMIGDAPGDLKAARAVKGRFFPVNPGHETESWERFYREAFDRFAAGTYAGEYEQRLIAEFDTLLPETPPWIAARR
jgi:phosphoglycolate phosphatase-like HAD superfamily hydrolase